MGDLEEFAGPLVFACCTHCEHTDQETDPCGQHDMPCEHGCNDAGTRGDVRWLTC